VTANTGHVCRLLYYFLFKPLRYGAILHAHPIHSELYILRHVDQEVATPCSIVPRRICSYVAAHAILQCWQPSVHTGLVLGFLSKMLCTWSGPVET